MSSYSSPPRHAVPTSSRQPVGDSPVQPAVPTYDLLGRPIDPRYLPYAIIKNADFISALMKNPKDYYTNTAGLHGGDDREALAHLKHQRERAPHLTFQNHALSRYPSSRPWWHSQSA
jgi:hypothetical protein